MACGRPPPPSAALRGRLAAAQHLSKRRAKPSRLGAEASCISAPCKVHSHSLTTPSRFGLSGFLHSPYLGSLSGCSWFLGVSCLGVKAVWEQKAAPCPSAQVLSPLLTHRWKEALEQVFIKSPVLVAMAYHAQVTA